MQAKASVYRVLKKSALQKSSNQLVTPNVNTIYKVEQVNLSCSDQFTRPINSSNPCQMIKRGILVIRR